jgi:hypothetical protein
VPEFEARVAQPSWLGRRRGELLGTPWRSRRRLPATERTRRGEPVALNFLRDSEVERVVPNALIVPAIGLGTIRST